MDDPVEDWQQRLMANLDRALQRSAAVEPLLYARLSGLRKQLAANWTASQAATPSEAEATEPGP